MVLQGVKRRSSLMFLVLTRDPKTSAGCIRLFFLEGVWGFLKVRGDPKKGSPLSRGSSPLFESVKSSLDSFQHPFFPQNREQFEESGTHFLSGD